MKKVVTIVLYSALGGALTLGSYKLLFEKNKLFIETSKSPALTTISTSNYPNSTVASVENTDFTVAAEKTINSVVYVKNTSIQTIQDPFAELFYGQGNGLRQFSQVGTGSGVIISSDGYIVTNNHVVDHAADIEITLNNKKMYKAKVIGTDPSNDIALLKIDAKNLPYITFGDSNNVQVGEWVLAVGNPYNLTSTVTAGIISAKGRDLGGNTNIDSFIQTDAAVNPGNSGGALVNTSGELIGINTAISSRTGSFIGYSFAIPSNIAKKVVEDLIEFGSVQTAVLGVQGNEFTEDLANKLQIEFNEGFYIANVLDNSGAKKSGLQKDDIIIKLDNVSITSFADLTGYLRTKRPNDAVKVTYIRNKKQYTTNVKLSKNMVSTVNALGLQLQNLDKEELKKLNIPNGVKIIGTTNSDLAYYGVKDGYIITAINNKKIYSVNDVDNIINNKGFKGSLKIEMINLDGETERYILR